ncbi:MAG: hypothetical protein Q4A30_00735 [Candidatus Saccharibacteria bacterium]|nr:hypothetical protein [Candidatus Saccharibacteria bacterium]
MADKKYLKIAAGVLLAIILVIVAVMAQLRMRVDDQKIKKPKLAIHELVDSKERKYELKFEYDEDKILQSNKGNQYKGEELNISFEEETLAKQRLENFEELKARVRNHGMRQERESFEELKIDGKEAFRTLVNQAMRTYIKLNDEDYLKFVVFDNQNEELDNEKKQILLEKPEIKLVFKTLRISRKG